MNYSGRITAAAALLLVPARWAAAAVPGEEGIVGRMAILVFQIALILFAAWLGGQLFNRFNLPSVIGELASGMVIGPYLLGSIALPGFAHGLFPLHGGFPVSPELYGFATVASIVLLFLVGLETDIDIFRRFAAAGSGIGIGGVAASFVLGDLTAVLFSRDVFGVTMGFADPVPLFLGVISTATSVGISARILTEKRKIDSPEGVTILSAAIIDDVLGIVILAVVLGTIRSGELNLGQAAVIALRAGVVWMGFMVLGLVFSSRISRSLKHLGDKVAISVMGLALALLLAGIFEKSGLAMIIGAYVMGLTLSKTDLAFMIRDNLVVLYRFFIPVFFCVMGMLVNPGDILDRRILLFSLVYSAGAILAKLIGCGLPAFFFDFNRRGAARIGMGMVPRGEVAMIVAGIGLAEGILGQEAFAVAVVMTFVTTLVPPPFFARMFDSAAAGLRREISYKPEREHLSFSVPNPETADLLMDKILGAFRLEGFFIHRPDLRRQVFQVRKDSTFITVRQLPGRIEFDCRREDLAFVHTLVYEVLAELERLMRHLQGISDREKIGQEIFNPATCPLVPNGERGKLARYFRPETVTADLSGKTKEEVLEELLALFVRARLLEPAREKNVLKELMEREKDMSTGMQEGIALPHVRTADVDRIACALGVSRKGVDFAALDGKPSRIFIATLIPAESPEPYLQLMAGIGQFLANPDNRKRLLACRTDEELYEIIRLI